MTAGAIAQGCGTPPLAAPRSNQGSIVEAAGYVLINIYPIACASDVRHPDLPLYHAAAGLSFRSLSPTAQRSIELFSASISRERHSIGPA